MNKSIGLIIILVVVGTGIYYFGLLETETTIKITTESSFVLSVYYINPEGDNKHVFLNDDQGDKEWKIKGVLTEAVLQIGYPDIYCKMEIYRGPRLLWSKESPRGEILRYNKDIT